MNAADNGQTTASLYIWAILALISKDLIRDGNYKAAMVECS